MTNREKALEWWNNYKWLVQQELTFVYYGKRHYESLTGREIEHIWKNEI